MISDVFNRISFTILIVTQIPQHVQTTDDPLIPATFYPFGRDQGDDVAPINDDGSTPEVSIGIGFPFFNSINTGLFVNTNGEVSFGTAVTSYTPLPFPLGDDMIVVAPYWCDVDTRPNNASIYYRETTDPTLLNRATQDVLEVYASRGFYFFKAKWIFIATWHRVTFYGGSATTPVNSFQSVLITDGTYSFTIFNYGIITWTTGTASGGDASTGLGGTAAQVGFNAGDGVVYYAVPWSRTPLIVNIEETSNCEIMGRWMFRIDSATIDAGGCSPTNGSCKAYQEENSNTHVCTDIAPAFDCPSLDGPTAISRKWIEFYCVVNSNVTDANVRFEVKFTFDGSEFADVPIFTTSPGSLIVTLHEQYLKGKLGKWIGCNVVTYWQSSPTQRSQPLTSTNSYWAGIEVANDLLAVSEGDTIFPTVLLKSTLPPTCSDALRSCLLAPTVKTTADIRIPKQPGTADGCKYVITEPQWNEDEQKAYNVSTVIQVVATRDSFVSAPRNNKIMVEFPPLFDRVINGISFPNMWSEYRLPDITVFRYDSLEAMCTATGDPRISSLDGLQYSTYATGQFYYVQSTAGVQVELHVRHWPCSGAVACVCGIALREGNAILAADMCTDGIPRYITYGLVPLGAGITTDPSGRFFQIQMPSGSKVQANLFSWGMNMYLYLIGNKRGKTEGLCGSFDGIPTNDLKVKGTNSYYNPVNGMIPTNVLESWRIPNGLSLFDGYLANLPTSGIDDSNLANSCDCECKLIPGTNDCTMPVCNALVLLTPNSWDPNIPIVPNVPAAFAATGIDNIDYEYDSNSIASATRSGFVDLSSQLKSISVHDAESHCQSLLWDDNPMREACSLSMTPGQEEPVIDKCVNDILATNDLSWANDKVSELQTICLFTTVSLNTSTSDNDSTDGISHIEGLINDVMQVVCSPADCSGHGTCNNGRCVCHPDYIGFGCDVLKTAVPWILRTYGPTDCNVRDRQCLSAQLETENVTFVENETACGIEVEKVDGTKTTYFTSALITSPWTTTCSLPEEALESFSNHLNFTDALPDDGSDDFWQITPGSPVLKYTISISNNGRDFGNSEDWLVLDSLCMICVGDTCQHRNDSCLINGYCFAHGDVNPYQDDEYCFVNVSTTQWTSPSECTTGDTCIHSCNGVPDGLYQMCRTCTHFVKCYVGIPDIPTPCPDATYWDDIKKSCQATSATCVECT